MRGWSSKNDAARVESLFNGMKDGYDEGDESLKPRFVDYAVRLRTWARVGEPEIALSVAQEMIAAYQSGLIDQNVTIRELNRLVESWICCSKPNSLLMAEMTLSTIFRDVFPSSKVADTDMLSSDQKSYLEKLKCFDSLLLAPDSVSFGMLISAYTKSDSSNAAMKALKLLNIAEELHGKGVSCRPNFLTYSDVIGALCREGGGNDAIDQVLDSLLDKDDEFWTSQLKAGLNIHSIIQKIDRILREKSKSAVLRNKSMTLMEKLEPFIIHRSSRKGKPKRHAENPKRRQGINNKRKAFQN